ncbi:MULTISPECIES: plasmid partition protein ParG [Nostocales]|uniref:ParG n=3 Tax=Nostocales TaxID=1161 RepID=A0A8S9TDC4_9CYAN|nr:plasmid partition protein ParG [Tolypothrix bouteillei]KAF3890168.1 hypothetical protein DA73_0400035505 [Tolypothrix bouteillei VB521301]
MHISIPDNIKKQFHAACAIRGLKMSQVVVELIEQWLKTNNVPEFGESMKTDKGTR